MEKTGRSQAALRRFYLKGEFSIFTNSLITSVCPEFVEIKPVDGVSSERVLADLTVVVAYRSAFREVFTELEECLPRLYAVGDAVSPRDLVSAMREGHLAARSIDNRNLEPMWKHL